MASQLTRREFLKLVGLLPLAGSPLVKYAQTANREPGVAQDPNILIILTP